MTTRKPDPASMLVVPALDIGESGESGVDGGVGTACGECELSGLLAGDVAQFLGAGTLRKWGTTL